MCLPQKLQAPPFPLLAYLFVGELRHSLYERDDDFIELIFLLIDARGLGVQLQQPMGIDLDGGHGLSMPGTYYSKTNLEQSEKTKLRPSAQRAFTLFSNSGLHIWNSLPLLPRYNPMWFIVLKAPTN